MLWPLCSTPTTAWRTWPASLATGDSLPSIWWRRGETTRLASAWLNAQSNHHLIWSRAASRSRHQARSSCLTASIKTKINLPSTPDSASILMRRVSIWNRMTSATTVNILIWARKTRINAQHPTYLTTPMPRSIRQPSASLMLSVKLDLTQSTS